MSVSAPTAYFTAIVWHRTARGHMAAVPCDKERARDGTAGGLVGLTVDIDGALYIVLSVESAAFGGPIRKGERIGLLVRPAPLPGTPTPNVKGSGNA